MRPITRRNASAAFAALVWLVCLPPAANGQSPGRIPVIGYLAVQDESEPGRRPAAFRKGLSELGYHEGSNLIVEYRWAGNRLGRLPSLAADLVRRQVDVIVALEPPGARAAIAATRTIPIVMRSSGDPVAAGYIRSLAHPGGNVTGLTSQSADLVGKRLELLLELHPGLSRIAVLFDSNDRGNPQQVKLLETVARTKRLDLLRYDVHTPEAIDQAFAAAKEHDIEGFLMARNPLVVRNRRRIVALARSRRAVAVYDDREFVEAGGLVSYGTDLEDLYRRAAIHVDKILRGAKPANLPFEQPTKFELVVNLKAADAIGIRIPQSILLRADVVIE